MKNQTGKAPGGASTEPSGPVLLSGGNPQIAKGEGDGHVQDGETIDESVPARWIEQRASFPAKRCRRRR
jgi:hypothetical protein